MQCWLRLGGGAVTRVSEHELAQMLSSNPDLISSEPAEENRPEPPAAKAKRLALGNVPTEAQDQRAVMTWAAWNAAWHPELRYLFHVPNEGNRSDVGHAVAVAEGLRPGVPDLLLPAAKGGFIGLAIEMKRVDHSNHPTDDQWYWIEGMRSNGWRVEVCYGFDETIAVLQDYLKGE